MIAILFNYNDVFFCLRKSTQTVFVSTVKQQTLMSSCELNLSDQGMYVYEDSNFVGVFRIPPINGIKF